MEKQIILINETPDGKEYEKPFNIQHAKNLLTMPNNGGWKLKEGQELDIELAKELDTPPVMGGDTTSTASTKSTNANIKRGNKKSTKKT